MFDKASPEPLDVIASNECGHMTLTAYRFRACFNEIERLRAGLEAIKKATVDGRVCDDVAWFDGITTLYDYIDQVLNGNGQVVAAAHEQRESGQ